MGHLARHCKEEYQDPRIPQTINPKYPYRKYFTQQSQSKNITNWASRYLIARINTQTINIHHPIRITKVGDLLTQITHNQTYKENYPISRLQNNNWTNVQNTQTGTHESQKNNVPIRILRY